jgi:ribose 5-phosphate isomerase B
MTVVIAGDHHTVALLKKIEAYLIGKNVDFVNVGSMDEQKKVALQKIIPAVVHPIQSHKAHAGILACGTGAGVEIGANKFSDIRASLCVLPKQAANARLYDDANV